MLNPTVNGYRNGNNMVTATARDMRHIIAELLGGNDRRAALAALDDLPAARLCGALPGFLCSPDPRIKWGAVQAMGRAASRLADQDMEAARGVMRRLLWSLNDESGGIGWGAAEAMGEIAARRQSLAEEFGPILVALMREDGYHLQYAPLAMQHGALWAVCRLATVRPGLLDSEAMHLAALLGASDPALRALAARALGLLHADMAQPELERLLTDHSPALIDQPDGMEHTTVATEAGRALELIKQTK